jgi:peptide/nickel transport system ATP-binding protein
MSNTSENILDVRNLVVHYETMEGVVNAVNGIDIQLKRQRTLGLVGETGAGKTTTALSILRLVPDPPGVIKSGQIFLDGTDILKLSEGKMRDVRGRDVAMIFQDPMTSLNPVLTVGEQIAEVLRIHEGLSRPDADRKVREMLEQVGIPGERATEYPHQFSGGMKQRVVIAIALVCNPKLLIADEPTTALDVTIQAQVLALMQELKNKRNTSMIMITHDLGIVAEVCDDVSILYAGRIVESGTVREVYKSTMHPYTEGLFNSLPVINNMQAKLKPIPGLMPDPIALPPGCPFSPRCRYVMDRCKETVPALRSLAGSAHRVACHAYDQPGFKLTGRM